MPVIPNPRQGLVVLTALGVAILAASVVVAPSAPSPAAATSGANPYETPLVVDQDPDPRVVETTLVADEAMVDLGNGVTAKGMTFNGAIPGPEFRLTVGDRVVVYLENHMDTAVTSIHWHGIELNNRSDGAPVTQNEVPPGGRFRYEFDVPRPGVFWYHPHFEGSTNQVFRGLEGSIVVTDAAGDENRLVAAGVLPPAEHTKTALLGDTTVCKAPGTNDATTYPADPYLPWAGGPPGSYPGQRGPHPVQLCETAPLDDHGDPRPAPYQAGEVPNIQSRVAHHNEGQTVLTNGKNVGGRAGYPEAPGALSPDASVLDVRPGQGIRLRAINGAAIRYFRLRLTDAAGNQIPLVRVGGQAGLLDAAVVEGGTPGGFDTKYARGEIVLAPAERADVVAAVPPDASGVATLWTLDFARTATGFSGLPSVPVMHFDVAGDPVVPAYTFAEGTPLLADPTVNHPNTPLGPPTGALLNPATFTPPKPGSGDPHIRFTAGDRVLPFGVDGIPGPQEHHGGYAGSPRLGTTRYARLGDTLELSIENQTSQHHPFHLHGFSFQPLKLERVGGGGPDYEFPYTEFRDEVDLPPGYLLRFRVSLEDRPQLDGRTMGGGLGRWMFHCHIFPHSTLGMMAELIVVDGAGNERPNIDAHSPSVTVTEGEVASVTGTFSDPDGDAVALTASVGEVADNGDGSWVWRHAASGPVRGQAVYITARDTRGNQGQDAISLQVEPAGAQPPPAAGQPPVVEAVPGYRMVAGDGGIFTFGAREFHGSTGDMRLNEPVVGGATDQSDYDGYWMVASDGGVFAFNAEFHGSLGGQTLSSPAVEIEPTPSGEGYWIVLADGKVHAFGDATHVGDFSGQRLNKPVIGMSVTTSGKGYWLVAEDGGIFNFGDAPFLGSMGGTRLNAPVIDLAPQVDNQGYYLMARDGGVFTFGSAEFRGSTGDMKLNAPVIAALVAPNGAGYWLAATDGGVFTFGGVEFLGSMGAVKLNSPVLDLID